MKDLDFFSPGARLARELEYLLRDTRDDAAQPQASTTLEAATPGGQAMTERERFEAWARPRWTHPEDFDARIKAPSKYNNYEVQAAWDAWQESAAQPAPSVPTESIGKMLAQAMEAAVANGANSVSMPDELVEVAAWLSGVQPNPANGQTRAVRDVIAERRRQIEVEGWAPDHDDRHGAHELAEAAACYCLSSAGKPFDYFETMWPWERWWFKVSDPRRDLVKAGALVLAEIERLDRAAAPKQEGE